MRAPAAEGEGGRRVKAIKYIIVLAFYVTIFVVPRKIPYKLFVFLLMRFLEAYVPRDPFFMSVCWLGGWSVIMS